MAVTIPNSERRTRYTPVASTTVFSVGFPIVAATDLEVWHDGEEVDADDYAVSLGALVDGFYSNASITFDTGVTGTVDIVGARPPERTEYFVEGAGISAARLNQEAARVALMIREIYDRQKRSLTGAPGTSELPLPTLVAKKILKVSDDGTAIELGPDYDSVVGETGPQGPQGEQGETGPQGPAGAGSGDVLGPGTVTAGHAATFADTSGTQLASAGYVPASTAIATTSAAGLIEQATAAEVYSATANKAIDAGLLESASAEVVLTDGASPSFDWDDGINRLWTMAANRTLPNPTNGQPGTYRTIRVIGNSATDRTLTFGTQYGGYLPSLSDIDSTKQYLLTIRCITSTHFIVSAQNCSAP